MSASLVITGTTSSGKSALFNLLCGAWITPVSVQPSTLSPVRAALVSNPTTTSPVDEENLERGQPISLELWPLSAHRSWLQLRLALREHRLRGALKRVGLTPSWMIYTRALKRARERAPSITELPALERLTEPQGLPQHTAQREYAFKALREASCVLFVFNAQETNPKVDEAALQSLKSALNKPIIFVLNRIDLYQADLDPQASLERRLHQIKQLWIKLYGQRAFPPLFSVSAELPALLYAAVNPRSGLQIAELKRFKRLARSEDLFSDHALEPSEWSLNLQTHLLSELCRQRGVDQLCGAIVSAITPPSTTR